MNENVYFVDETTNPPNVPQARPVYEGGWEAKTQQELISRIQSQLKKIWLKFFTIPHGKGEDEIACHCGHWSASHLTDNEIVKQKLKWI